MVGWCGGGVVMGHVSTNGHSVNRHYSTVVEEEEDRRKRVNRSAQQHIVNSNCQWLGGRINPLCSWGQGRVCNMHAVILITDAYPYSWHDAWRGTVVSVLGWCGGGGFYSTRSRRRLSTNHSASSYYRWLNAKVGNNAVGIHSVCFPYARGVHFISSCHRALSLDRLSQTPRSVAL